MVTEHLAYQLLASYGNDKEITTALENFDFYILPIVNPDGSPSSLPKP
jgi:Zinc carboxypeptidase.